MNKVKIQVNTPNKEYYFYPNGNNCQLLTPDGRSDATLFRKSPCPGGRREPRGSTCTGRSTSRRRSSSPTPPTCSPKSCLGWEDKCKLIADTWQNTGMTLFLCECKCRLIKIKIVKYHY